MSTHRINLRGPWEFRWLTPPIDDRPANGTVKLPSTWQDTISSGAGLVMFSRRFGLPTNLSDSSKVFFTLDAIGGDGTVLLNGNFLGVVTRSDKAQQFEVTDLLQARNLVEISVNFNPDPVQKLPGGLYKYVGLDIVEQDDQEELETVFY